MKLESPVCKDAGYPVNQSLKVSSNVDIKRNA